MNEGISSSFLSLKPLCNNITISPTIENLDKLRENVSNTPKHVVQQLHEYILFPLYINLQKEELKTNTKIKIEIISTLKVILQKIRLHKLNVFNSLYITLVQQIYDKNSPNLVTLVEEEFKLGVVQCLIYIFKNISLDLLCDLYNRKSTVQFSQCIHTCVQMAKREKFRSLRLCAIECIMTVAYVHDEADFRDEEIRSQVADIIMFFFPGITLGLRDVALDDVKQGHKITACSIKALSRIIVLLMQDDENMDNENIIIEYPTKNIQTEIIEDCSIKKKRRTVEEMLKSVKTDTRSVKWCKDTGNKLQIVIKSMASLQSHDHPMVRNQLLEMCEDILTYCCINMVRSVAVCIEILIALSEDDDEAISKKSQNALDKVLQKSVTALNSTVLDIVQENFYDVITKLPRVINGSDLMKQLSILNLFVGYLRLLGPSNLFNILQSRSHLKRLVFSLLHITRLEKSNISLFEEYAIRDFESVSQTSTTWKHFTYLREKSLLQKTQIALEILSKSNATEILVDFLCDVFNNEVENRNEAIYLLNEILSVKVEKINERANLIYHILNIYLEQDNWYLQLVVKNNEDEQVTLSEVHNHIVQTCLLVDGVGCMAKALGEHFKQFLFKVLYVVLERAGSAQPYISAAGFTALLNISNACCYTNATRLIVDNTDYISFHITQRFKKMERNPMVMDVLRVVMNYSTIDVMPFILEIINGVLLQSCDKYQQHNITAFLNIFYSFTQNLQRWLNLTKQDENRLNTLLVAFKKNMQNLFSLYSIHDTLFSGSLLQNKMFCEKMSGSIPEQYKEMPWAVENDENDIKDDDEYKTSEPAEYIKLTVAVLQRSLNFLPSKDRQQKLLVLQIFQRGIIIINSWENELLPIIHLVWSPLADRFKEHSEPLIINKSFELLITMAKVSKDFIRQRTSKHVFPDICVMLKNSADSSYLKDRGSAYRYTQLYKLQMAILKDLAALIHNLEMKISDVEVAMDAALPYLNDKQPIPLQELAVTFYKNLARYDFDSVWLFLINVFGVEKSENGKICEIGYKKNVESILKVLDLAKW